MVKLRLFVAFGLGMLAGVLLWPDGNDSPDSTRQPVEPPQVSAISETRTPVEPRRSYSPSQPEAFAWDRGGMQGFRGDPASDFPPAYAQPGYPEVPGGSGYRFRPLDTDADSRSDRRYTGNYSSPPGVSRGSGGPGWNEAPAYVQPQPQWRTPPRYDNRRHRFGAPPGHLYSAR
jgi:hypothetical protein